MKKSASKDNSTSVHSPKPFFAKRGDGSFFDQINEVEQPFIAPNVSRQIDGDYHTPHKPFFRAKPQPIIQAKLTINELGDPYEQEADAVADRVMRMESTLSNPMDGEDQPIQNMPLAISRLQRQKISEEEESIQTMPLAIQRKCAECETEEKDSLQTKPLMRKSGGGSYTASPQMTSQLNSSKGGGQPLSADTNAFMSSSFGTDFSHVRIHTDSRTSEMNEGLSARAFTHGSDVYFNGGEYKPESSEGRRLLAHELTHVIQQSMEVMSLQRQADINQAPRDLPCTMVTGLQPHPGTNVMFGQNSSRLTGDGQRAIRTFFDQWRRGIPVLINIDGFASEEGAQVLNWRLSCRRAVTVSSFLMHLGVPPNYIQTTAQGETTEFGEAHKQNRRAVLTIVGGAAPAPSPMPEQPMEIQTHADDEGRQRQVVCVRRLGGCANTRPGGIPAPEEITTYNQRCRPETHYLGPDVTPNGEECRHPPTPPPAPEPMEVTVVDDSDYVGWAASATRIGEVYMTDTSSMVTNVLAASGRNPISRLNILDHGNPKGVQIGNDWITMTNVASFVPVLSRLRGHFTSGGFVHLQHCNAGQNLDLMRTLAAAFGVPVYAGTGLHNPVYRFNFGEYVRCDPDGTCTRDVGRP